MTEATDQERAALMSALVTEHFVLQSVSGATVSESSSRAAIYLSALSSGLVAIGFASSHPGIFEVLLFTVLPAVFLLGCFTVVRLIDTSVENMVAVQRIERIRRYYATVHPLAAQFFEEDAYGARHPGIRGVHYRTSSILFTMASVIVFVNAILGGVTLGVVFAVGMGSNTALSVGVGIAAGVVTLAAGLVYDTVRIRPIMIRPPLLVSVDIP